MTEAWRHWEGQIVNNEFYLQKYLGGSDQSAVFLTQYKAREHKQAAIKLVPADAAKAELQLQRWDLAKTLSHPHLIHVYEKGRCRLGTTDFVFAVMEYAEENLGQILPERRLTGEEARALLDPAMDALSYLHGQGLIHGRLKPANVMASGDQLKLSSDSVWSGGPFPNLGKPSLYDPPEAATGGTSPGADVWSLGMTLAEVLTQRLPSFNDRGNPVLPADMPAPFLEIVRGCLRRSPRSRFTVWDIAAHLRSGKPLPLEKESVSSQGKSGKRRFGTPVVIALTILVAVAVALGLLLRPSAKPEQKAASQEAARPAGKAGDQQPGSTGKASPATRVKPSPTSSTSVPPAPTNRNAPAGSEVVHRVLPDVPQTALDTIQGTIRVSVKVRVDRSGNVLGSEVDSPGSSKYFARLAMQAAQNWKFAPSSQNELREFILRFEFTDTDIRAVATRAAR